MELAVLINILLAAFGTVLWFLFRDMKTKVEKNQEDFLNYKTYVAETYVNHPALAKAIDTMSKNIEAVASGVTRIEERLYRLQQEHSND